MSLRQASRLAEGWVSPSDYLLASREDRPADFVVGNPPYIRYDDLPAETLEAYRSSYSTLVGRFDLYVGFIEAGVRQLKVGGALGFICADRWMRSAYGIELRRLIADTCGVEVVIEMHNAPAFQDDVAAYPAVVVLRRGQQREAILASAGAAAGQPLDSNLAELVVELAGHRISLVPGFTAARLSRWFTGGNPWPSVDPEHLQLLQRLEDTSQPLEDPKTGTKIGIGVATGADQIFVTRDPSVVESDRLLPLAMSSDTRSGRVQWSGHYLVDPWGADGRLLDLGSYPMMAAYFASHRARLEDRNIARRSGSDWYRTIDRVNHDLIVREKLYFQDMKVVSNPALDRGQTYPHHNLYWLTSMEWDLEVLGGLLLSRVAQFFIEAYCVKMRGGTLRFQAQYLRRIRVPRPESLSAALQEDLRGAFARRDARAATQAALDAYQVEQSLRSLLQ